MLLDRRKSVRARARASRRILRTIRLRHPNLMFLAGLVGASIMVSYTLNCFKP